MRVRDTGTGVRVLLRFKRGILDGVLKADAVFDHQKKGRKSRPKIEWPLVFDRQTYSRE